MREVAQFFKVLADEARLQMIWLLSNHRELCVCDLTEALGISQSKASRHLATLRHAGLVVDRRAGTWQHYSLCLARDELERGQLDALRRRLADHPGAARVLKRLRGWLARKERQAVGCDPHDVRAPGPTRRPAPRRSLHTGGSR